MDNLEEMDIFLETYKLQKLKQEEIKTFNRLITSKEVETVFKNLPKNKSPGQMASQGNFSHFSKK